MAREFLAAPVRWAVGNLHRLGPPGGMLVSINPERLLVQVDRNLGPQRRRAGQAVREALTIHDGLQSGVAARLGRGSRSSPPAPRRPRTPGRRSARSAASRSSGPRRPLRDVPDPPPPRLLGVRRLVLDLRLQRQAERPRVKDRTTAVRSMRRPALSTGSIRSVAWRSLVESLDLFGAGSGGYPGVADACDPRRISVPSDSIMARGRRMGC